MPFHVLSALAKFFTGPKIEAKRWQDIFTVINMWLLMNVLFIWYYYLSIMAQAMPLQASAARLWLLSTLSCPEACMWPSEVSDAVLCNPL